MTPHYADSWLQVYGGDCREVLATLPAESVHCVVTSPPYWGLRDYGTAQWSGGDAGCDHVAQKKPPTVGSSSGLGYPADGGQRRIAEGNTYHEAYTAQFAHTCGKCGAVRQDNQLGLEPTPEEYVANMVSVFREVRRVLRRDGTLWLNLGDSYTANPGSGQARGEATFLGKSGTYDASDIGRGGKAWKGLPGKNLVGIPWRVAFALQADGWYLRSDIIWAKPNPMPESVTDRPTKSHEYLFLFAKSERYYFDADAVREEPTTPPFRPLSPKMIAAGRMSTDREGYWTNPAGRNIRSVWTIPTQPYPGAHFAVFPPKLVEPCIKAGTSERGVCVECGAPWRRVLSVIRGERDDSTRDPAKRDARRGMLAVPEKGWESERTTTGWQPSCSHDAATVPATVLDPFAGSGTVGVVAQRLSRRAVLVDLNPDYLKQQLERNAALPLGLVG